MELFLLGSLCNWRAGSTEKQSTTHRFVLTCVDVNKVCLWVKISWADCMRSEEVLHRVKEERNILHTIKRRKAKCIGHVLCRNWLLKHIIKGKVEVLVEVTGRQGRRSKQLLEDFNKARGRWKLKAETIDRAVWIIRFARGYEHVVRQTTEWVNVVLINTSIRKFLWYLRLEFESDSHSCTLFF